MFESVGILFVLLLHRKIVVRFFIQWSVVLIFSTGYLKSNGWSSVKKWQSIDLTLTYNLPSPEKAGLVLRECLTSMLRACKVQGSALKLGGPVTAGFFQRADGKPVLTPRFWKEFGCAKYRQPCHFFEENKSNHSFKERRKRKPGERFCSNPWIHFHRVKVYGIKRTGCTFQACCSWQKLNPKDTSLNIPGFDNILEY